LDTVRQRNSKKLTLIAVGASFNQEIVVLLHMGPREGKEGGRGEGGWRGAAA